MMDKIFNMSGRNCESENNFLKSTMSSSGVIVGSPGIICATILYPASFEI
jgi:hypothetical protein